jgi:hypothetical protein
MKKKKVDAAKTYSSFKIPAGIEVKIVNAKGVIVGSLILENDTDIVFGFKQKNADGAMINYKTVFCNPKKVIYHVREEI